MQRTGADNRHGGDCDANRFVLHGDGCMLVLHVVSCLCICCRWLGLC